ncbi:MAG: pyrroline-5-carboxylate reductase [Proteobacteria bacterium]|nr:pyrroline-5-carboxylate reductase [Pseudomonadota bacterium]
MKILLIGCGNLGRALLTAWMPDQKKYKILVIQPSLSAQALFPSFHFVRNASEIPIDFNPDSVIIAIKPQQFQEAFPLYSLYLRTSLVISFAAGISIACLKTYFENNNRCIRVMPNVAMKVGKSVNLVYADPSLPQKDRALAEDILNVTGSFFWLKAESLIEALTPISASGPAYFYMLSNILVQLATENGLEESFARELVQKTFLGSALLTSPPYNFTEMISSVASKGGVTEAALKALTPDFSDLMEKAYEAAATKLKTLGK